MQWLTFELGVFQEAQETKRGIGESIADAGLDLAEKTVDITTESKDGSNLFQSFGQKVGEYYDRAVEKSKEALKATGHAISTSYDKIKEKTKEFME